ncbi:EpsG family protein [Parabacteroides distasonis]|jgi:hypothetical protein B2_10119|uniref:EpsG family protein n=1 Tax=Parabacteroides distasonis TaxID=823 RepID=UPI0039B5D9AD
MEAFFIVFAGFRDPESQYNDSHNYLTLFNYGGTYLLKHVEIGYALINLLVMKMNLGFQWVILITSSISMIAIAWAAKRSGKNEAAVLILFYILTYFFYNFNAMRQMTGVSILILGYTYLKEERIRAFLLCLLIAFLFHKSCLIAIVCLLFYKKDTVFQPIMVFACIIGSLVIGFLNITPTILSSMADLFPRYLNSDIDKTVAESSFSLSKIALSAFFLYMYSFLDKEDLYLKIVFVGIVLFNLMSFSGGAMRIAYAFTPAQALLFAAYKNNEDLMWVLDYEKYEYIIYGYALFVYYYMLLNSIGLQDYQFCDGRFF